MYNKWAPAIANVQCKWWWSVFIPAQLTEENGSVTRAKYHHYWTYTNWTLLLTFFGPNILNCKLCHKMPKALWFSTGRTSGFDLYRFLGIFLSIFLSSLLNSSWVSNLQFHLLRNFSSWFTKAVPALLKFFLRLTWYINRIMSWTMSTHPVCFSAEWLNAPPFCLSPLSVVTGVNRRFKYSL